MNLEYTNCFICAEALGEVTGAAAAWDFLPARGEGWLELSDQIRRFEPGVREGLLLNAEVSEGDRTVVVRFSDGRWSAWSVREQANEAAGAEAARSVEERYLSSAPMQGDKKPVMRYRTYWTAQEEAGVKVWTPTVSRFCGWE